MSNNDLITADQPSALVRYGGDNEVATLAQRLMRFHPAAAEVGDRAMQAAAQLALMYGANPLPGNNELHIWKDNKGKVCVQLGIGYYTRLAQQLGGLMWYEQPRPMNADERKLYGVSQNDLAWIARAFRADDWRRNKALTDEQVWRMFGATGIGISGANEYAKAGRPQSWTAEKRCRTDIYRRLFPAQLVRELATIPVAIDDEDAAIVIDSESIPSGDERQASINADLLGYDDETTPEPPDDDLPAGEEEQGVTWSADFVQYCADNISRYAGNVHAVKNALKKVCKTPPLNRKEARQQFEALREYATKRDAEDAAAAEAKAQAQAQEA